MNGETDNKTAPEELTSKSTPEIAASNSQTTEAIPSGTVVSTEPLWLVFDTETTGLVNNATSDLRAQPYVIEFAGVLINRNGDIVKEVEFLAKPPVAITKTITDITGLTDEKLKDAPPFDCDTVQNLIDYPGVEAAVAHNLSFDRAMLTFEFQRAERTLRWPPKMLCTVEATYPINGRRMKLGQMYKHFFGEDFAGAHRAMADVKALAKCTAYMIQKGII